MVWEPAPPAVDEAVAAMLAVAAREQDEQWLTPWIRQRVRASDTDR